MSAVPPPTRRRWQRQGHAMRGGLWWSSQQLTSLLEQNRSGRLQMWKGLGAWSAQRLHPSERTPQSGWKDEGEGVVAASINTSLRWKRREMGACPRTYCVLIVGGKRWEMWGQLMTFYLCCTLESTDVVVGFFVCVCGSAKNRDTDEMIVVKKSKSLSLWEFYLNKK